MGHFDKNRIHLQKILKISLHIVAFQNIIVISMFLEQNIIFNEQEVDPSPLSLSEHDL